MARGYGSLYTETIHPFGRGVSNTATISTGVQYGLLTSTAASSVTFASIETVTVPLPTNAMINELEIGLTAGVVITVTTTDTIALRCRITDTGGTSYDTLLTSTGSMAASTTIVTDYTFAKRATPSDGTYFTGKGSFDIDCQVAASATTSKAAASVKNSSYVTYKYYLVA